MRLLIGFLCATLMTAQTVADLTKIFDAYLAAVKAKDFKAVTALYRASVKRDVLDTYPTAKEQEAFLKSLAEMAPDSISDPTVTPHGSKGALLNFTGAKRVPPDIQKSRKLPPVAKMPMVVEFANEGGAWKMGPPAFAGEAPSASEKKAPKDLNMGTRADYVEQSATQLGGPILRTEKQAAGTVYVIRMVDGVIAAFVPAKLVTPDFQIGKAIQMQGAMHKKDPQKFWADNAKLFQLQPGKK